MKKRLTLNEEGELVMEEVTMSRAETEKLEKKRENWNKRKNRKEKEDEEKRNLNEEDKNQLKDLEQNKTDEECGQELKNRREELEMDIEQTQYQINNCDDDQKENLEIQMMEYKKLRQELYPSNEEEEAIEEDEASQENGWEDEKMEGTEHISDDTGVNNSDVESVEMKASVKEK